MSVNTRIALWIIGGLAVLVAGYQLYAYYNLPSTSTQSASAGRATAIAAQAMNNGRCTNTVQDAVLGSNPQELNPGGGCFIRLSEDVRGECITAYDRKGRPLGNDCDGNLNLAGKFPAKFASASGTEVAVSYILCDRVGTTTLVVNGCP